MIYGDFLNNIMDYCEKHNESIIRDALGRIVFTDEIETFATNDYNIFVNPACADSLSTEEIVGLLAHECMHEIMGHMTATWTIYDKGSGISRNSWHYLCNVAADLSINNWLEKEGYTLPNWVLRRTAEKYAKLIKPTSISSHEIFKDLLPAAKQMNEAIQEAIEQMRKEEEDSEKVKGQGKKTPDKNGYPIDGKPSKSKEGKGDFSNDNSAKDNSDNDSISKVSVKGGKLVDQDGNPVEINENGDIAEISDEDYENLSDENKKAVDDMRKIGKRLKEMLDDNKGEGSDSDSDEGKETPVIGDNSGGNNSDRNNQSEEDAGNEKGDEKKQAEIEKLLADMRKIDRERKKDAEGESKENEEQVDGIDDEQEEEHKGDKRLIDILPNPPPELKREIVQQDDDYYAEATYDIPDYDWVEDIFSRLGNYLNTNTRNYTYRRINKRGNYSMPDSDLYAPRKGYAYDNHDKPRCYFYMDVSGSMYWNEEDYSSEIDRPNIIRERLLAHIGELKDTSSVVVPFATRLGQELDVESRISTNLNLGGGTSLNLVVADINNRNDNFDMSVIITDMDNGFDISNIDDTKFVIIVTNHKDKVYGKHSDLLTVIGLEEFV